MVRVPWFNWDIPEVSLAWAIPEACNGVVKGAAKAVKLADRWLDPAVAERQRESDEEFERKLPKEFVAVRTRQEKGLIEDADQLSDELEEASFRVYRREMKKEVLGDTDEGTTEFSMRRLLPQDRPAEEAVARYLLLEAAAAGPAEEEVEATSPEAQWRRDKLVQAQLQRADKAMRARVKPGAVVAVTELTKGTALGAALFFALRTGWRLLRAQASTRGRRRPPPSKQRLERPAPPSSRQQGAQRPGTSRAGTGRPGTSTRKR